MYGSQRGVTNRLQMASGYKIPQLAFGTYRMEHSEIPEAVKVSLESGFRHFDCAPVYLNEPQIGSALQAEMKAQRISREEVFVTSKLWCTDQDPQHVRAACKRTIKDLRVDFLDLYLMHWPVCWAHPQGSSYTNPESWRPTSIGGGMHVVKEVTIQQTWKAMEELVKEGLVKSIGVSNCSTSHLEDLIGVASEPIALNQVELHPGCQPVGLGADHERLKILTGAYCPLGAPTRFTPKGFDGLLNNPYIKDLSTRTGFPPGRLLLNWGLDNKAVVVVKSKSPDRIRSNSKAQTGMLTGATRTTISLFQDTIQSVRVINPVGFQGVPGSSWFGDN